MLCPNTNYVPQMNPQMNQWLILVNQFFRMVHVNEAVQ